MGPLQRTPGTASTAISQDHRWLRCCERISRVKNRMREICTSGSVRGGGGNVPTYSAFGVVNRRQITPERRWFMKMPVRREEGLLVSGEGLLQVVQKQPPKHPRQNPDRREETPSARDTTPTVRR